MHTVYEENKIPLNSYLGITKIQKKKNNFKTLNILFRVRDEDFFIYLLIMRNVYALNKQK